MLNHFDTMRYCLCNTENRMQCVSRSVRHRLSQFQVEFIKPTFLADFSSTNLLLLMSCLDNDDKYYNNKPQFR